MRDVTPLAVELRPMYKGDFFRKINGELVALADFLCDYV
jgi:hypothetical protein